MALTFSTFMEGRILPLEAKIEAINVILQSSLGWTDEYILNSKRNILTCGAVQNLLDLYRVSAEATFTVNQLRQKSNQ